MTRSISAGVTVVIATRDRREKLLANLARLPEPIVVVDNASSDGTADAVAERYPRVHVIRCERDIGSAPPAPGAGGAAPPPRPLPGGRPLGGGRTLGAEAAATPLVAFTDDDSWWEPGALARAAAHFDAHPRLGLLAARIIVEPEGRLDPTCAQMRDSPLSAAGLPGPAVLGFLACGAVARRAAFLECGGFHGRFGFGGEEELLALDMKAAGWGLAYADDVVAHHEPERGVRRHRTARELRNRLWSAWLRRPLPRAARMTLATHPAAVVRALRGLPWVLSERRGVPPPGGGGGGAPPRA